MRIIRSLEDLKVVERGIATMGTFDGVHRGHRKIFETLFEESGSHQRKILVTFDPHPQEIVMSPRHPVLIQLLTTTEEKLDFLKGFGFDEILVIPFTKELSMKSAEQFVREVLIDRVGIRAMVVGYDHSFGKNREGNPRLLKQLGEKYQFTVTVVDPLMEENFPVNSTRIRRTLQAGDVKLASRMLGRNYLITGKVVEGLKRGKTLGFPTANLIPNSPKKLIPANGVYSVRVRWEENEFPSVLNVGYRPTFGGEERVIEAHLLGYQGNLYGTNLTIEFQERIRDEKKFQNEEQLAEQIQKDIHTAKSLVS